MKLNQFSFSVLKAVKLTGDFVKSNQEMFNFSKNNQHFFSFSSAHVFALALSYFGFTQMKISTHNFLSIHETEGCGNEEATYNNKPEWPLLFPQLYEIERFLA